MTWPTKYFDTISFMARRFGLSIISSITGAEDFLIRGGAGVVDVDDWLSTIEGGVSRHSKTEIAEGEDVNDVSSGRILPVLPNSYGLSGSANDSTKNYIIIIWKMPKLPPKSE